jgi:hypothetical protein
MPYVKRWRNYYFAGARKFIGMRIIAKNGGQNQKKNRVFTLKTRVGVKKTTRNDQKHTRKDKKRPKNDKKRPKKRGCEINCVNGHRIDKLLKGKEFYGPEDEAQQSPGWDTGKTDR